MQPWMISALPACKKKNLHQESSLAYEWRSAVIYGTPQKIPSEGGSETVFTTNFCLYGGEN